MEWEWGGGGGGGEHGLPKLSAMIVKLTMHLLKCNVSWPPPKVNHLPLPLLQQESIIRSSINGTRTLVRGEGGRSTI